MKATIYEMRFENWKYFTDFLPTAQELRMIERIYGKMITIEVHNI